VESKHLRAYNAVIELDEYCQSCRNCDDCIFRHIPCPINNFTDEEKNDMKIAVEELEGERHGKS